MALSVNFSAAQVPGSPGNILFTDLTTGTDVLVVKRRIYIQGSDGVFVVIDGNANEYSDWDDYPSVTTLTLIDILSKDIGAKVTVQWLDVSNSVRYDKIQYIGFPCFNEDFDYGLTQNVAGNQLLVNDNSFWANKTLLQTYIDSGDKAIERNSDISSAQICYDLATALRLKSQYYFNQNS